MRFTVPRDDLLKALNLVSNVVERRQTLAVVANILFEIKEQTLVLTGTDTEIEIRSSAPLSFSETETGAITIPAKKLVDICKSLPENSEISFTLSEQKKIEIVCHKSRFVLSTLPADEFPNSDDSSFVANFSTTQKNFKKLVESTDFAMAQQDIRYYLNGMLLEVSENTLRSVATDGHRLALCSIEDANINAASTYQLIVPRKGIHELSRSVHESDALIELSFGLTHLMAKTADFTFITKLIDGKFPDYRRVVPTVSGLHFLASRQKLKESLTRAAILSNDKFRGVKLILQNNLLTINANNPEQEEAEEQLEVEYVGNEIQVGFNVTYLLDVLNAISGETVKFNLSDGATSSLIYDANDESAAYVIMPMRL